MTPTELKTIMGNIAASRERISQIKVTPDNKADIEIVLRCLREAWDDAYLLERETAQAEMVHGLPVLMPITTELLPAPKN